MDTQQLSTLRIHKLTKEQYKRELREGRVNNNEIYLTPPDEQSNWDQNDTTASDYIRNRPFYTDYEVDFKFLETVVNFNIEEKDGIYRFDGSGIIQDISEYLFNEGVKFLVVFNGIKYISTCRYQDDKYYIGNGTFFDMDDIESELPFYITVSEDEQVIAYSSIQGNSNIAVYSLLDEQIHKIDKKYLPDDILEKPNWEEYEVESPNYIYNKPFYDSRDTNIVFDKIITFDKKSNRGNYYYVNLEESDACWMQSTGKVTIIFNGIRYNAQIYSEKNGTSNTFYYVGNGKLWDSKYNGNNEPFVMGFESFGLVGSIVSIISGDIQILVEEWGEGELCTLDEKYLPYPVQPRITGIAGQFVVIGDDGNMTTKTILNAEEGEF